MKPLALNRHEYKSVEIQMVNEANATPDDQVIDTNRESLISLDD